MTPKILVVRKMSALEYHYNGNHKSAALKESHEEHNRNTKKILETLKKAGFVYKVVTRDELTEELVDEHDFVLSAGGDGTVIATAAFNKNKPQLNLKTDAKSKGALCQHDINKALEAFIKGNYTIEKWTRQDVYFDNKFVGRVLNETCIGELLKLSKMARYNIKVDGKIELQENSGIIIATGTGSTGWPSAFEPYSKTSNIFKFKTILPTKGSESGEGSHFVIEYKKHEGKFALDTIEYDIPRDFVLEIKLSENPLKVIKLA